MHSPTQSRAVPAPEPTPIRIIESRSQYRSCHVEVPDLNQRLAAIFLDGCYYSFFRVEPDQKRVLILADKLNHRGDKTVITKTPKGYAIWVLETEAVLAEAAQPKLPASHQQKARLPYKFLASRSQYEICHIRVPDLDKPLAAIYFEQKYYSLFKVVDTVEQVMQLIQKLSYRGEKAVITKTQKGYGLWLLEPRAYVRL